MPARALNFRRILILSAGWLFIVLGVLGLFLPFLYFVGALRLSSSPPSIGRVSELSQSLARLRIDGRDGSAAMDELEAHGR